MSSNGKVLVLDSSAFIMGLDLLNLNLRLFTTPTVINELSSFWVKLKYSTAIYVGKLLVVTPKKKFLIEVEKASSSTGNGLKLSEADISVLALALELKSRGLNPTIVSDDFSVQNVAEYLGLNYTYLSGKGIKSQVKWIWYCPGCRRKFSSAVFEDVCPICGVKLKRKAIKKTSLSKETNK
ncbi:hypothetical protein DRO26_02820 [Candidatus Bathyarchaeota archaeon]|nr:MAG: hypothetical protein DRO26_02820 [Candidatus Bathyarchaeota archaeon]